MFDDLDKAQRQWRQRSLFKRRSRRRPWWRLLALIAIAAALLLWQDEVLAWLASQVGSFN